MIHGLGRGERQIWGGEGGEELADMNGQLVTKCKKL